MSKPSRTTLLVAFVLAAALLAAACTPLGQPALRQPASSPRIWDSSDPAVLIDADKTYLFGSTNNKRVPVRLITSFQTSLTTSRTTWAGGPRDAMPTRPAWVDAGESEIWAPSVIKIGTRYHLYFAAHHAGATTDEANDQCIGRASSTTPMGPYAPEASPIYCGLPAEPAGHGLPASNAFGRGALDPEVIRAADGSLWLLAAISRTPDSIASIRLSTAGLPASRNATPTVLVKRTAPWQDGTDNGTLAGGFMENPSMVYEPRTKTYLLFYSAGSWWTSAYLTGFARCTAPQGPCTVDTRGPFLVGGSGRSGAGGLTAFRDAAGVLRASYSTWTAGHEAPATNPGGIYSRQGHWAKIVVSTTSDPAAQSVRLGIP